MSLSGWLKLGWLALAADAVYWLFGGAGAFDDSGPPISDAHAAMNAVLYFGGWLLFAVLVVVSYLVWRVNAGPRA